MSGEKLNDPEGAYLSGTQDQTPSKFFSNRKLNLLLLDQSPFSPTLPTSSSFIPLKMDVSVCAMGPACSLIDRLFLIVAQLHPGTSQSTWSTHPQRYERNQSCTTSHPLYIPIQCPDRSPDSLYLSLWKATATLNQDYYKNPACIPALASIVTSSPEQAVRKPGEYMEPLSELGVV